MTKATERGYRARLLVVIRWLAGVATQMRPSNAPALRSDATRWLESQPIEIVCVLLPMPIWIPPPEGPWGTRDITSIS